MPDVEGDRRDQHDADRGIGLVEERLQPRVAVPLVAQHHADPREQQAERPAADEGIDVERDQLHPRHPGGEGDEGAHHRQHPPDQDRPRSPAVEEPVRQIQLARADQHVAAELLRHRPPAAPPDLIGDDRAEVAAQRPGGRGEEQVHLPGGHQIAGERHDDFGRQRDAGALDRHQQRDAPIAAGGDHGDGEAGKRGQDLFDHARRLRQRAAKGKHEVRNRGAPATVRCE